MVASKLLCILPYRDRLYAEILKKKKEMQRLLRCGSDSSEHHCRGKGWGLQRMHSMSS